MIPHPDSRLYRCSVTNHALARGATETLSSRGGEGGRFNPRARAGRDPCFDHPSSERQNQAFSATEVAGGWLHPRLHGEDRQNSRYTHGAKDHGWLCLLRVRAGFERR